jgi:hypothetical protein
MTADTRTSHLSVTTACLPLCTHIASRSPHVAHTSRSELSAVVVPGSGSGSNLGCYISAHQCETPTSSLFCVARHLRSQYGRAASIRHQALCGQPELEVRCVRFLLRHIWSGSLLAHQQQLRDGVYLLVTSAVAHCDRCCAREPALLPIRVAASSWITDLTYSFVPAAPRRASSPISLPSKYIYFQQMNACVRRRRGWCSRAPVCTCRRYGAVQDVFIPKDRETGR